MQHDRHGWWLADAGPVAPAAPLTGDASADVVIVGGGYAGLWAAWHLLDAGASVAILEAEVCGHGPSGRNGGFVDNLWHSAPRVRARLGDAAALALGRASGESVHAIGSWCDEQGVDAWYRRSGQLILSAAPAQDGIGSAVAEACAELGIPEEAHAVSAEDARARCDSPVFRGGTFMPTAATVHPARLALGLRAKLIERGARVYEGTRVLELRGPEARTEGGRVRGGTAIITAGCGALSTSPLKRALTGVSSHMVITEPVPDVIEQVGWTGGEAITDGRSLLHYFRTTRDGRIAFGWAGGQISMGARVRGRAEVDARVAEQTRRDLVRFFPALAGRAVTHAWGGPIDASPSHLPTIEPLDGGRVWAAYGFTGNGVGPAHLVGRILARLASGRSDELTALPVVDPPRDRVPPEPFRWLGGNLIRAALERKEAAEEEGRAPNPVADWVATTPARLGYHIGR